MDNVWSEANEYPISQLWPEQKVSLGGGATFKALWDKDNLFVLVNVPDDDFYPADESQQASWLSDKPVPVATCQY